MPHFEFIWIDDNIEHLATNGLAPEDAENAMRKPASSFDSHSSGRRGIKGYATDGRLIAVIFERIDELTVYVVTAYHITREP
jgi:uncharacterized DUF497 family protein